MKANSSNLIIDGPITPKMVEAMGKKGLISKNSQGTETLWLKTGRTDNLKAVSDFVDLVEKTARGTIKTVAEEDFDNTILPIFLLGSERLVHEDVKLKFRQPAVLLNGAYNVENLTSAALRFREIVYKHETLINRLSYGVLNQEKQRSFAGGAITLSASTLQEMGIVHGVLKRDRNTKDSN